MTKPVVAFRNFANAPDSDTICCVIDMAYMLCMFVIDKPASCMLDTNRDAVVLAAGNQRGPQICPVPSSLLI
jgi:hypothetical protein